MKKKLLLIFAGVIALLISCNKVLDQAPKGQLGGAVLENKDGAEALVIACYSTLDNKDPNPAWGWGNVGSNLLNNPSLWESGDLRSDDCYKGGDSPDDVGEYGQIESGNFQPTNLAFQVIWKGHYVSISRCNKALQVMSRISDADFPLRIRRIAEVKTLRSFFYMRLKQLYRTFPWIDENVVTGEEGKVSNNLTEDQLWDKILADANAGVDIPVDPVDKGRVNGDVAYSIIAKINMFRGKYQLALDAANKVINSGRYRLITDLEKLYSDPNEEHTGENIFSLEANIGATGANDGDLRFNWCDIWVAPFQGPYGGGDGFQRPSQNLVNAFKVDANGLPLLDTYNNTKLDSADITTPVDPRLDLAIGRPGIRWKDFTDRAQPLSWARALGTYGPYVKKKNLIYVKSPLRYKDGFPWAGGALNLPFIKYSEILLIKAECLIELSQDLDGARTLVNLIRNRAKNTPYVKSFTNPAVNAANYQIGLYPSTGWTQDYARKAVRFERRLELCLEGQRFFDLRRWGIAKQTVDAYRNVEKAFRTYLTVATYFAPKIDYYPIPQTEIDISRGVLKQDPNY